MAKRLLVTSSPHYRSERTISKVMIDVVIAMIPISAMSVVFFGWRALALTLICVGACIAFETIFNHIAKKRNTVDDFSAVVTGMLLSFNLPVTAPYWVAVIGALFAIVVVKMLFGGLGKNFANPALAARAFLFSWPTIMTTFVRPFITPGLPVLYDPIFTNGAEMPEYIDTITTATPLASLKSGTLPDISLADMFIGNIGGCLGEVCAAAIILGGLYMLFRGVITWHIPVTYIGTVALITFIFPLTGGHFDWQFMTYELLSGGLLLGAFFMATDYSTSPVTAKGKLIFGIGCGLLTVFLRYYSGYSEGVSYAILIMNVLAYPIDKITRPRRYGKGGGYSDSSK
ncbi:MAG: RnfABCDGE type electron transport complex subunit D [Ruminococcaceae bacterium]|nr:RnfABCDGE type electron transport complex subunit D [Oscillospiraceae bacterium]